MNLWIQLGMLQIFCFGLGYTFAYIKYNSKREK